MKNAGGLGLKRDFSDSQVANSGYTINRKSSFMWYNKTMNNDFEDIDFDNARPARSRIAETVAAVARHRRESERNALIHEIAVVVGGLVLVGAIALLVRYQCQRSEQLEHERQTFARQQQAAEEAARREAAAQQLKIEEARKRAEDARRAAEQTRLENTRKQREQEQILRDNAILFRKALTCFRNGKIDYGRNASISDLPDKVTSEAKFLYLVPGGVSSFSLYDVFVRPGQPLAVRELSEKELPQDVAAEEFNRLIETTPCLTVRNFLDNPSLVGARPTLYFHSPVPRPQTASIPDADTSLNPSREEFGELYGALKAIGGGQLVYTYQIDVHIPGWQQDVPIQTVRFADEIGRNAFERSIQRELENRLRNSAPKGTRPIVTRELLESTLKKATVLLKIKR